MHFLRNKTSFIIYFINSFINTYDLALNSPLRMYATDRWRVTHMGYLGLLTTQLLGQFIFWYMTRHDYMNGHNMSALLPVLLVYPAKIYITSLINLVNKSAFLNAEISCRQLACIWRFQGMEEWVIRREASFCNHPG